MLAKTLADNPELVAEGIVEGETITVNAVEQSLKLLHQKKKKSIN
jgi:uncharacterized protein YoaH (UPF0181 family)